MRDFQNSLPSDPRLPWKELLKKLAHCKKVEITVIDRPGQLYRKIRKEKFDEVYLVCSYLSMPTYALLCGFKIRKKVYVLFNRIKFDDYLAIFKKYKLRSLDPFYLLSMVKLGWLYRFITKANGTTSRYLLRYSLGLSLATYSAIIPL